MLLLLIHTCFWLVHFDFPVADYYMDAWKGTNRTPRGIKRIYMVKLKSSSLQNYEQYRSVSDSLSLSNNHLPQIPLLFLPSHSFHHSETK